MKRLTRRRFLHAAGAGGLLYAMGKTPGTMIAEAASVNGFSDYKALVCVHLLGGNDSWSMVVPRSEAEYNAYAASRQNLAIAKDALLPITPMGGGEYGLHPSMTGLASLFDQGRCAVIANVGPLIAPTTREQYEAKAVPVPPQLFSHNDQQGQWYTLRGRLPSKSGWAGRMADLLASQLSGQQLAMNVSLSGTTLFQAGSFATPYVMGATGPESFKAFGKSGSKLARQNAFERVLGVDRNSAYARAYSDVHQRALGNAQLVNSALASAPALATQFPESALSTQLLTVARMIAVREALGMSRQVFFVAVGGFDTHDNQLEEQPVLLGDVSASLAAFHAATVELGVASSVTAFTQSDFGRSLSSNGDGSDHAWGGVQMVIGGAVMGRDIYGQYPVLEIGTDNDVGGGRFIPSTSSDQYAATLARWFGVDDTQMHLVAPNLANFAEQDLGFLT
jgi:uncharacterized protein (DUF1501 family)